MNRNGQLNHLRRGHRSGFTLVELLVVIVVIGLLISILVPAVTEVRARARETTTRGTQGTLQTALETFKADGRIGGGYPPSRSDAPEDAANAGRVGNPYNQQWSSSPNPLPISGAGLLVWALAGADLQGCPGFRPFRSGSSFWSDDTDAANQNNNPALSGAYALHNTTQQPLHPRSGPFVDASKISMSRANPAAGHEHFEIEAEVEARDEMGLGHADRFYPMFLDSFGFPILYWRADPAGARMADEDRTALGTWRGMYHWIDNGALLEDDYNLEPTLVLRPGSETHRLDWEEGILPPPGGGQSGFSPGHFQYYIRNPDVQARDASHNADTYLLISPGQDGLYGTADDIANFEHNGEE